RPLLNEILLELERLSAETDFEFITNHLAQDVPSRLTFSSYPEEDSVINKYNYCYACESKEEINIVRSPSQSSVSICILPEESHRITKRVESKNGHLVIDCPIPQGLLTNIPHSNTKEFTHLRYTACTSDSGSFKTENFMLRQIEYEPLRQTDLFILITINDDEDETHLSRTLHGIMKNVAYFCSPENPETWGKDGWKKVVICIISNGRDNINNRILAYLTVLGAYQDGVAKALVDNKLVEAHIYEYTVQIPIQSLEDTVDMESKDYGVVPTQILFCLKEKRKDKADTYQWFFNAFCPILNPKICILIEAGIKLGDKSIYDLWKSFSARPQVAGVCGQINIMNNIGWIKLLNPIVAAQIFKHKLSYIIDMPFESAFGYITSMPEGFCAYRYPALQNITEHTEDRVFGFELITKPDCSWILHYEKSVQVEKYIPEDLTKFKQKQICLIN
ncbi:7877_t:CDS:2, partial [Racocetra persica]